MEACKVKEIFMKTCTNCDKPKQDSEFHKDCTRNDGLACWCKECSIKAQLERVRTLDGALKLLVKDAKGNAEARLKKGRVKAGMFAIDYEYVKQLYDKKQGRCHLSGVPMTTEPGLFKMSLERPNPSKGYIPGNAELICLCFNTRLQWTKEDLRAVVQNYLSGDDFPPVLIPDDPPRPRKKYTKIIEEIRDGLTYVRCTWCSNFKVSSDFLKDKCQGCSKCRKAREQERLNTKRGHFQKMLRSATSHTKARNENESRCKTNSKFTFDELNALYERQGGRCAVSKMPLEVGPHKKWACSLDRLDVNIGYVPSNVRLVAALFQATDNSVKLKDQAEAAGFGWTEERFEMMIATTRKEFGL